MNGKNCYLEKLGHLQSAVVSASNTESLEVSANMYLLAILSLWIGQIPAMKSVIVRFMLNVHKFSRIAGYMVLLD